MNSMVTENQPATVAARPTVVMCYRLLDLAASCGVHDFTDGIYGEEESRSEAAYMKAQWRQSEYLLDQIRCDCGFRVLDIGCGNGRLLRQAQQRGAQAVGITISAEQVARCQTQGLDVRLLNYRSLPQAWDRSFDGLVANGSLEHFVSIEEAAAGQDDERYEEMFAICRRLVSAGCRLATTAIHFREPGQVNAEEIPRGPSSFAKDGPEYHFAVLERSFGGWYPVPGQLQRCARGYFHLVREVDGTRDYHLTSEYWLLRLKWLVASRPRFWAGIAWNLARHPGPTLQMLRCLLVDQSWNWQFRGDPPPRLLLRQTWEAV